MTSYRLINAGFALDVAQGADGPVLLGVGPAGAAPARVGQLGLSQAGKEAPTETGLVPTGADAPVMHGLEVLDERGVRVPVWWRDVAIGEGDGRIACTTQAAACAATVEITAEPGGCFDIAATVAAHAGHRVARVAIGFDLPQRFGLAHYAGGRWNAEFDWHAHMLEVGAGLSIASHAGRTGHDHGPQITLAAAGATMTRGDALGIALHAPGDFGIDVERTRDGPLRVVAHLAVDGDAPAAIRLTLAPSTTGQQGVARAMHARLNAKVWGGPVPVRKVHYNTWEGVYFDHDPAVLADLVARAARLGVERWVLDDGWFKGRDDDTTSLGDWQVDARKYPQGLGPLIEMVRSAGMDFGLWVEPEMVNPDSDLYRAHPDWVLRHGDAPLVTARNQLVLDLSRAEVRDFVVETICGLLEAHDIAYLKWDMNRDTWQKFGADGRFVAGAYGAGLHDVLGRITAAHPGVEIESCASGGARANAAILGPTKRVWTSDCNDALERQRIQHGFRRFFPASVMGAHAGPRRCHTTGRVLDMEFRAQTALMGHMGCEMDLRELTPEEEETLGHWFARYKDLRDLIHGGQALFFDRVDGGEIVHGVVDGARTLVQIAQLDRPRFGLAEPLRLDHADPGRTYRVTWLRGPHAERTARTMKRLPPVWEDGDTVTVDGTTLKGGLPIPVMYPAQAMTLLIEEI